MYAKTSLLAFESDHSSDGKPLRITIYKCRKIPIISPGFIFVRKAVLLGLFSGELIIGGNFEFQNGLDLTAKTALTTTTSWLKQLKTTKPNSLWA